ncbi:hypothetical protein [Saccharibacillus alkalitolerans]|uniref:SbsC C-terminal domain-containing protein n=1 Tax=Saccharibacillus alkalitolerans TaxID=2705290 RepID=A0ABX0FAJ6_9BACL|nr:hypothetical protein [Saccharibacillus alkalitolerans]NGZ77308.1 hypothetical protein [Saccharibacillus alkalitolerans]
MKKWWSLSLSLALLGSAVVPASVFAAETVPSQTQQAEDEAELSPAMLAALEYTDRIDAIVKYEDKAADTFNSVGYVSAANRKEVYKKLNGIVVPNYSKFYYELKQIKPTDPKLSKLHSYYLQGASLQLQGMELIKKSLYGANINWTTYKQGQAKLKSGKAKLDLFISSFDKYMDSLE